MIGLTSLLVAIGLAQVFYFRKSVIDTGGAARAAVKAADATQQVVDVFKSRNELQLRAYVHLERGVVQDIAPGRTPVAEVSVKNFGRTPANNVIAWLHFFLMPTDSPEREVPVFDRPGTMTTLPSGEPMVTQLHFDRPITDDEFAQLQQGKIEFLAYGAIRYADVFGRIWRTKFEFKTRRLENLGGRIGTIISGSGNETVEENAAGKQ